MTTSATKNQTKMIKIAYGNTRVGQYIPVILVTPPKTAAAPTIA